jgi:hypothetical protein
MQNIFSMNLATEKELAEMKIRAANSSIEFKSKPDDKFIQSIEIEI